MAPTLRRPTKHCRRSFDSCAVAWLLAAAGVAGPAVAAAQTTDPIFRSWRWSEEITAPRAFGLGGAATGLADDGAAAVLNPAGLATLPRAGEIQVGVVFRDQVTLPRGDRVQTFTRPTSPATFAMRLGSRVGLSYQFVEARPAARIEFADGPRSGDLTSSVSGPGLGIGLRISPEWNLGVGLNVLRLNIEDGSYVRAVTPVSPDLRVRLQASGSSSLSPGVGVLRVNPAGDFVLGAVFRWGVRWQGVRTAIDPSTGVVIDEGSRFEIRSPAVWSAGASWQPQLRRAWRFLLTVQGDYLLLGAIKPTAPPGLPFPAGDYSMENAFEGRAGVELTIPVFERWLRHGPGRPNRLQLRGGWHHAAAATLVYGGTDPVEQAVFPRGADRELWTVGASLGSSTIWRVSGAYRFGRDHLAVAGLSIRYPGLFP